MAAGNTGRRIASALWRWASSLSTKSSSVLPCSGFGPRATSPIASGSCRVPSCGITNSTGALSVCLPRWALKSQSSRIGVSPDSTRAQAVCVGTIGGFACGCLKNAMPGSSAS